MDESSLLTESVGQILLRQAKTRGDATALAWMDRGPGGGDGDGGGDGILRRMTYGRLAAAVNAVAHQLDHLPRGERVVVWGANSVEWVLVEYACAARGLVLVAYNTAWTDAEASSATELVEPALVFAGSGGRAAPLLERAERLPGAPPVRALADLSPLVDGSVAAASDAFLDVAPGEPFLIQFTSGTTGRAKGAVLTHRAAVNSAFLRLRPTTSSADVTLNSVPFHHVGGSVFVLLGALTTGSALVVTDSFNAEESVRLLTAAQVTQLGGVPTMVERVLDRPDAAAAVSGLRMVALGGTDISPALVRRIRDEVGAVVMVTYGQSECPLISNTAATDAPERVATTAGQSAEETEICIVDARTGEEVPVGETGEILVRSPMVMEGYFRMPEQTAQTLRADGLLRTGDLGSFDADGYLTIRGRLREVIIRGGENIYPAEVEAALGEHPDVLACAVVGLDDPHLGEQVAASVVTVGDRDPAELEAFLADRVAHFKIPRTWRFVAELPVTASGKVRRTAVRDSMQSSIKPV
ncbi:fatty-acyl-CoA synthase/long-chain acyl-CoA synthetase [Jatrophihabitans sp. GAS493]|uniref:class I adenylate-forming enzyme family protein n=1 Tax=Jatrophihabitans sp. GAS493 TaxID=1907575 RepID=UPI000BB8E9FF|nr:class I adenylate-forming enzyme family protein [Jatrophihabitans sp. GAS493]SOD72132.1 fatty-acyl-CoA synthase/long-chain acyl-CoA synthetase [Jatrophihabitans sp. GAS493]